ncbi:hypothetical protein RhiirA4_486244, partial [Rhizophagus irregularis]
VAEAVVAAYLIYSRSFSLIKYILAEKLHRPQNKYRSYPYCNELDLYNDLELKDTFLKSDNHSKLIKDKSSLKSDSYSKLNDLELALKLNQDQDAVMLAYLLEYYSENSMTHIGWMINVTKILPKLPANYIDLLLYKPCFGGMKFNFLNKRFYILSDSLKLKVYKPITRLIPAKSVKFLKYKKIRNEESPNIFVFPNFTTNDSNNDETPRKIPRDILYYFGNILLPPSYNSNEEEFGSFLQIVNKDAFFDVPLIEVALTSRWMQTERYWRIPLILYIIFLYLFSFLSQLYLSDNDDKNKQSAMFMALVGIYYYVGIIILGVIVFTLIFIKAFNEINVINNEEIVILLTVTTLILWIEMLLWLRLFTEVAVYIYIFGNILKKIIPFFVFMLILSFGFGHSMFVLFGHPSLLDLNPSISTFTLNNGTGNFTLTGESLDNPFDTLWNAILSAYYWNTINLSDYNYWPLKIFAFITNVILVLVLLNMIIALMNDTFYKAKEDGNLGLLMFRAELINDYEQLDNPFFSKRIYNNSLYICFCQDSDLMKNWIEKSQKLGGTKLYSWFKESIDKENIIYDDVHIKAWYKLISGNGSFTPDDHNNESQHDNPWF